MHEIPASAGEIVDAVLGISRTAPVAILDSCGVPHLGSHLMLAGIDPVAAIEISGDTSRTLSLLDKHLTGDLAAVFTLSYDLGRKMLSIGGRDEDPEEPDAFVCLFDTLHIHDYLTGKTWVTGDHKKFAQVEERLRSGHSDKWNDEINPSVVTSNFTRSEYIKAILEIQERIRDGDTYQTNLTQCLTAALPEEFAPQSAFKKLREMHPAPFSAFLRRNSDVVISASPERFFKVDPQSGEIRTSPIKGTRPRGSDPESDLALQQELISSQKDRAENTMIVDLLRNDLGRVCDYGSVRVEKLCELEEHPSLFHLVSTISGRLRSAIRPSEILQALFPCGSITGAPKISTMKIISEIEPHPRGLSMGAIGYYIPPGVFDLAPILDLSVAIRTMVIRDRTATFNVGGGIVIDSDPEAEYDESLTKAVALLSSINGHLK